MTEVTVRGEAGTLLTHIQAGAYALLGDEPKTVPGGTDQGPGPYDLLLSALGTCTSMTLLLYAQRKKYPLERITVTLTHDRIYATDCAECDSKDGRIERIETVIHLEGALSDEQRNSLLAIAEKCPVHKTLMSKIDLPVRFGLPATI